MNPILLREKERREGEEGEKKRKRKEKKKRRRKEKKRKEGRVEWREGGRAGGAPFFLRTKPHPRPWLFTLVCFLFLFHVKRGRQRTTL